MNSAITLHQNDFGILLTFYCRDESGHPIDLTGYSVEFYLYDGETCINQDHALCTKPNAPQGIAEYKLVQSDTTSPGIFHGTLRLQDGDTFVQTIRTIPLIIES